MENAIKMAKTSHILKPQTKQKTAYSSIDGFLVAGIGFEPMTFWL